jgi:hypothetical protein
MVKILKLLSGEELIADVVVGREEVTIQKPFHLSRSEKSGR